MQRTLPSFLNQNIDITKLTKGVYDENINLVKFRNCIWFTNLDIAKRHEILNTIYTYKGNEDKYPKYDNYGDINVDKVATIPLDYEGVMGMPITFFWINIILNNLK